jgi:hypothetical protein
VAARLLHVVKECWLRVTVATAAKGGRELCSVKKSRMAAVEMSMSEKKWEGLRGIIQLLSGARVDVLRGRISSS